MSLIHIIIILGSSDHRFRRTGRRADKRLTNLAGPNPKGAEPGVGRVAPLRQGPGEWGPDTWAVGCLGGRGTSGVTSGAFL